MRLKPPRRHRGETRYPSNSLLLSSELRGALERKGDEAGRDRDQAVAFQCGCGGSIEILGSPRGGGYEPQRCRSTLPKRAFEAALLAQGLIAAPAGWALCGERALAAAGDTREADRRAEVHQRLGAA